MSFARAMRGLRRPSLDARSETPSRQAPDRKERAISDTLLFFPARYGSRLTCDAPRSTPYD